MPPTPEQNSLANSLEAQIEKAAADKDLETMRELLPQYEKLVLEMTGRSIDQIETFSLKEQLERFKSFYESHDISTPEDFETQITEIWNRNQDKIKEAIEQHGFDEILFIPAYDTKDINDKTTGEYNETYQGDNFKNAGSFEGIHDTRTGTRIVLTYKDENLSHTEHSNTKGKSIYDLCNATTDTEKAHIDLLIQNKQPLPIEGLTLGEYLIADRIHFKETGQHLDYSSSWTWLPASYSGSRVADSSWFPDGSQVDVGADVSDDRDSGLGLRSSRVFS
jgi:hypothetical protein